MRCVTAGVCREFEVCQRCALCGFFARKVGSVVTTIDTALYYSISGNYVNGILGIRAVSPFVVYRRGGDRVSAMRV